ncbi:MAG: STAS domain-containing protein [Rhodoferax sp.]|nr:STAS domain-containing protein [Rhodoferax sp.]
MATKDNSPGLLSKMAKFVRNPLKDWTELDKPEPEPDRESGYSKQALKEMIERKRQNDFVRRREFDQLRKLRRNEPSITPELAGRPSFFQSSIAANSEERADTLKKIDEIEAQMSKQWWKGKQDDTQAAPTSFPVAATNPVSQDDTMPTMAPSSEVTHTFSSTQPSRLDMDAAQLPGADEAPTQMGASAPTAGPVPTPEARSQPKFKSTRSRNFDAGISKYSASQLVSIEMSDNLADPDLEEAAIRYANGDDAGAEAGLLAALKAADITQDAADGWAAGLFDLYRATGQQASFDRVAIDYAERFGRSAPAWFSTPELLASTTVETTSNSSPPTAPLKQSSWECPADFDLLAMQALRIVTSRVGVAWHLNWSRLNNITAAAALSLSELFAQWCKQPVKLYFSGADALERTLQAATPMGDKQVEMYWWQLRLDALRILRMHDEFELAALDYCVTYEVSPPPWEEARCEYIFERVKTSDDLPKSGADDLAAGGDPDDSQAATAQMGLDSAEATVVELTGEVLGDAAEALDKLQAGLQGSDRLVISCERLIRVDFSAAGSILNWVATRESEGCQVQFREVPRLVAAFFNVIGINEHARVSLRTR